jgi:hypothetical protein
MPLLLVAGCVVRHPPPTVADPGRSPQESWALVLDRYVDDRGRVNFAGITASPDPLEHYVAYVGTVSETAEPKMFADPNAALAFSINAYNALAMYNVIVSGKRPTDKLGFFFWQEFQIIGHYRSLYGFEKDVIRECGDPRVHFALNCMTRSCPRLQRTPFDGAALDRQLEDAAREFFNDERNVLVDNDAKLVSLSWIMSFYKKDFLRAAPSLMAYVNRYRDEPVPADYRIRWLRYDWSLNTTAVE